MGGNKPLILKLLEDRVDRPRARTPRVIRPRRDLLDQLIAVPRFDLQEQQDGSSDVASPLAAATPPRRATSKVVAVSSVPVIWSAPQATPSNARADTAAALCTALRCLESVAARPALLPLPSHVVARALQAPALLFEAPHGSAAGAP